MDKMKKTVIRKQSLEEMKKTYQGMLSCHFPQDEIKPFRVIEDSYKKGNYICYGLYKIQESSQTAGSSESSESGECLAYAWMCYIPEENWVLLDYFAVDGSLRGQGMGSWFLREILENYTGETPVIIEVEDPDRIDVTAGTKAEVEGQRRKQLRRISFYQRNGVRETELRASVLKVPYRIMVYLKSIPAASGEEQSDVRDLNFDRESLKKAYYSFYSHIEKSVLIGNLHEIERS